jgi:hypothetical protein
MISEALPAPSRRSRARAPSLGGGVTAGSGGGDKRAGMAGVEGDELAARGEGRAASEAPKSVS